MPVPVHTPRINNNDDFVRVTHFYVEPGAAVRRGDPLVDLETDKASFTVEAERECYLLGFKAELGESVAVGSVLAWMGDRADETVPTEDTPAESAAAAGHAPTLKAALLLAQHGLAATDIPTTGDRLTATDVENYLASRPAVHSKAAAPTVDHGTAPTEPGRRIELTGSDRGMMFTVLWQREAVPAYLEISYDPRAWDAYAAEFQKRHRLLMSPLLALFAAHLAKIAAGSPAINATVAGAEKHVYDHVNLGFTVQTGAGLFVVVARDAENLDELALVQKLGDLQRSAMRGALHPADVSGATIGFSSMARWAVTRHIPVLLPHTALMIAHCAPAGDSATLGATYDHRVLHGADVFRVLQSLVVPPGKEENPPQ